MSQQIKCLVWDVDNTMWNGTLAEGGACKLRPGLRDALRKLDSRGVLLSIASTNDFAAVETHLKKKGIWSYFVHPQINWENKVNSLREIASRLNIIPGSMGFIDDEPFELAQVDKLLSDVRTYHAKDFLNLLQFSEFNPSFLTPESRRRRLMYIGSDERTAAQKTGGRNRIDFLKWTETHLNLREAQDSDIPRIMELLNRTSQLNATGIVYSLAEVCKFVHYSHHRVFVATLKDRFVDYGTIGVAICELESSTWRLISFLLSCRVLSRGISGVFLNWVHNTAQQNGASTVEVCYKKRPRNNKMYMLFKMSGFRYARKIQGEMSIYNQSHPMKIGFPNWLKINSEVCNDAM